MSLEAGTRVGRYTITRLLAQGGMAEVYRAEQDLAGGISRPVAVKVIRPEYSESQDFREMFLDEARTACTLSHPNIVHIYEVGEEDGQLYMAMELVTGETLATINRTLRTHGERLSDEALFAIGVATAAALEAVHALRVEGGTVNLVHRDVSPHNLLLSSNGALKLIDFGIAKAATNRNLTMPGVTKGKAGYFSPEQAMGKRLDGRSDLFSLGVTLYKLACGATPFDEHSNHAERHAALVRGQFKHLDAVYPGLPEGFYAVLRALLAVKPEDRSQSALEVREAFERAAFDARLRVGPSSLVGYVDAEGEVTSSGGSHASVRAAVAVLSSGDLEEASDDDVDEVEDVASGAFAAATTLPMDGSSKPVPRRATPRSSPQSAAPLGPVPTRAALRTDRLSPVAPGRGMSAKSAMVLLAFIASIIVGVLGVLLLGRPARDPNPATVVVSAPLLPPVVDAPVAPREEEPAPELDPGPLPEIKPAKHDRPKPKVVRTEPRPAAAPAPPPSERTEATIPEGRGTLRMNVVPPTGVRLVVDSADWGEPPLNQKIESGWHRVVVRLPDGTTATTRVAVRPDETTLLRFDATSRRWSNE